MYYEFENIIFLLQRCAHGVDNNDLLRDSSVNQRAW